MAFLAERCVRTVLTPKILRLCDPFSCGNKDLDEFFIVDSVEYGKQLMGKTW